MSGALSFQGKTAVITGAANGIGRALAEHCADLSMSLVLADLDIKALTELRKKLSANGTRVVSEAIDVSDIGQMQHLSDIARDNFGNVQLLFNNAGVMVDGRCWERSDSDWRWCFEVNVFGVINGLRIFVPSMLAHKEPAWIVNIASQAGLCVSPFLGPYTATKHAVVGISETLYYELKIENAALGVSVACPGAVKNTALWECETVRQQQFGDRSPLAAADEKGFRSALQGMMAQGLTPAELASIIFAGIAEKRFWIMSDSEYRKPLQCRFDSQMQGTLPIFDIQ